MTPTPAVADDNLEFAFPDDAGARLDSIQELQQVREAMKKFLPCTRPSCGLRCATAWPTRTSRIAWVFCVNGRAVMSAKDVRGFALFWIALEDMDRMRRARKQLEERMARRAVAAEWIETLGSGERADHLAFDGWLRESKLNIKCYLELEALDKQVQALDVAIADARNWRKTFRTRPWLAGLG